MAVNFPYGFSVTSKEPVDSRFLMTPAEMLAAGSRMPDYYLAICASGVDAGKIFVYNSTNSVDATYGRFRKISYSDLRDQPALAAVATSGAYGDLTGAPALATVATTGAYNDLSGKPALATVATTGAYSDLTGKPAPLVTINDWNNALESNVPVSTLVKTSLDNKVDKVAGKGLSTNDFTTEEKSKLDALPANAEANVITSIQKNGVTLAINNKTVNVEVPTALSGFTNDSGFITSAVNNLANYYTKTDTYTKTEVNELVAVKVSMTIVQSLPAEGNATTIYLVPKSSTSAGNVYDEYIWVDNSWELIGNTSGGSGTVDITQTASAISINGTALQSANSSQIGLMTTTQASKLEGIAANAEVNVQADWNESDNTSDAYIANKPSLAIVATTGAYSDLSGTPTLATVATSGAYSDLSGTPDLSGYVETTDLATVATTGAYSDLSGTPDLSGYAETANLATVATSGDYGDLQNKPDLSGYAESSSLATVATTGAYSDLSGAPTLATVATSGAYGDLTGTPTLATVATSGAYSDLSGTPDLTTKVDANAAITGATKCKITYDAKGLVTAGAELQASDIPDISATYATQTDLLGKQDVLTAGTNISIQNNVISADVSGALVYKGTVATFADLQNIQNPQVGWMYFVTADNISYAWNGSAWGQTSGATNIDTSITANSGNPVASSTLYTAFAGKVDANTAIVAGTYPKITYDTKGLVTGGAALQASDIPDISATYATQTDLSGKVDANTALSAGATKCKITYDTKGLVTAGADLQASDIPDLSATYATQTDLSGKVSALATGPTAGTYTKVTVTADGLVSGGDSLVENDIPALSISKTTGLQTALDNKLDDTQLVTSFASTVLDTNIPSEKLVKDSLDNKVAKNADITPGTAMKITYDAKGLVTAGATAATSDLSDWSTVDGGLVHTADLINASAGSADAGKPIKLNADGKIDDTMMPPLAIGEVITNSPSTYANLITLSTAQKGDIAVVNAETGEDINKNGVYWLNGVYSTASNWVQIVGPSNVISVNGATGVVTLGIANLNGITQGEIDAIDSGINSTKVSTYDGYATLIAGKEATITGAATTITSADLTAGMALVSDVNGKVAASADVSATELAYLNGVTSAIQTQIDGKVTKNEDISAVSTPALAKLSYDTKGLITGTAAVAASDLPDITASKVTDFAGTVRTTMAAYLVEVDLSNIASTNDGKTYTIPVTAKPYGVMLLKNGNQVMCDMNVGSSNIVLNFSSAITASQFKLTYVMDPAIPATPSEPASA